MSAESNRMSVFGHPNNASIINSIRQYYRADPIGNMLEWIEAMRSDPNVDHRLAQNLTFQTEQSLAGIQSRGCPGRGQHGSDHDA